GPNLINQRLSDLPPASLREYGVCGRKLTRQQIRTLCTMNRLTRALSRWNRMAIREKCRNLRGEWRKAKFALPLAWFASPDSANQHSCPDWFLMNPAPFPALRRHGPSP